MNWIYRKGLNMTMTTLNMRTNKGRRGKWQMEKEMDADEGSLFSGKKELPDYQDIFTHR